MEYVCNNNGGLPGPQIGGWYSCYENIDDATMRRFDESSYVINITLSRDNLKEAEEIETEEFS